MKRNLPKEMVKRKGMWRYHSMPFEVLPIAIRVEGKAKDHRLMVLIDNGSTHSFLDEGMTKMLRCELTGTQLLSVMVTNGNKVLCKSVCEGFCWEMHRENFEADLRLLRLAGCDIVLGVDWKKGVSLISFDFNKMEVTFGRMEEG